MNEYDSLPAPNSGHSRKIHLDTPDLRSAVDLHYIPDHPPLIEGITPSTPQEADIEHYLDAIAPPLLDLLSNN